MEGMLKAFAAMLGISPQEIKQSAVEVIASVKSVDARLARIEAALGIKSADVVEHPNAANNQRG